MNEVRKLLEARFPGLHQRIEQTLVEAEARYNRQSQQPASEFLLEHTRRVAAIARKLALSEGVDPVLPVLVALYHDAGKFHEGEYHKDAVPEEEHAAVIAGRMLAEHGLQRADIFMTNMILDRPPEKRSPTPQEIAFYAPFVERVIDIVQPAVIVPLGRVAMEYMLKKLDLPEKRQKISQLHGKLIKARLPYGEIHVVPMYHPAVVLYSASQKETIRKDFEKLKLFV